MNKKGSIFSFLFLCSALSAEYDIQERKTSVYLAKKEITQALDSYLAYFEKEKKHSTELLKEIAFTILEEGLHSPDLEDQLLALYGFSLSGETSSLHYLHSCLHSHHPVVQGAAIRQLAQMHDDRVNDLLLLGMRSDYLPIRLEALHHLVTRKARFSLGHVDSLMNLLPARFRFHFVPFYALHGSNEANIILKQMITESNIDVQIAVLNACSQFVKEDLLQNVRAALSHTNPMVKEAAASACGKLQDLDAIKFLKEAELSSFKDTSLAATFALFSLGEKDAHLPILSLAKDGNLFAISLLASVEEGIPLLTNLLSHKDSNICVNACLSLLAHKQTCTLPTVAHILTLDLKDLLFAPIASSGGSLMAWSSYSPDLLTDPMEKKWVLSSMQKLQEQVLAQTMLFSEQDALRIAEKILQNSQNHLVPALMQHLENIDSENVRVFLRKHAKNNPNILKNAYCNLTLYKLDDGPEHQASFLAWVAKQKNVPTITLQPLLENRDLLNSPFELHPEETSRCFLDALIAVSTKHEPENIPILLQTMKTGSEKNRFTLAGLLLQSIR